MSVAPAPPPRRVLVARCEDCGTETRRRPFEDIRCPACGSRDVLPVAVITLPTPAARAAA